MFESAVFYAFAAVLLVSATLVITSRNPVHSALFLVLAFFTAAGTWLLLRAEFLAIALVVVYVGAVMVLFLFVVMMLDINIERLREGFWRNLPLAIVVGGVLVFEMIAVLANRIYGARPRELPPGTIGYVPQVEDVDWRFPVSVRDLEIIREARRNEEGGLAKIAVAAEAVKGLAGVVAVAQGKIVAEDQGEAG